MIYQVSNCDRADTYPSSEEKLANALNQIDNLNQRIAEMERGLIGSALKARRWLKNTLQRFTAASQRFRQIEQQHGKREAIRKTFGRLSRRNSAMPVKTLEADDDAHAPFAPHILSSENTASIDENKDAHSRQPRMRVTWLVGGFLPKGGGHRNIFRMCHQLEQFGHKVSIYVTDVIQGDEALRSDVHANFYPISGGIQRYKGTMEETDVLVATHWSTVQACLESKKMAKSIAYFVQDYEPMFYPMGSDYLLAEQTYRRHLYHICSGEWIAALIKERHGGTVGHFKFPVDAAIYHDKKRARKSRRVVFFAKPEMPRRCFTIGIQALSLAATKMDDLEVILYGSPEISEYSFPFRHQKLKFVGTLQELSDLYSEATLGVCFSTTNPSLVPYEMMACGLPVLDLATEKAELNYGGSRDIAILAGPDPHDVANAIVRAFAHPEDLARRTLLGLELVASFPNETQAARIVEFHLQRSLVLADGHETTDRVGT